MDEQLKAFYTDAEALDGILGAEQASRDRAAAFIEALAAFGIAQSHITVDDFGLFEHEGLQALIQAFIDAGPFDALPLASVKVLRFVSADSVASDLTSIREALHVHRDRMAQFSRRFNIEVVLHLYLEDLQAEPLGEIADFAWSESLDELGIFYQFSEREVAQSHALQRELAALLQFPALKHPNIRLGNFPFCFYPVADFRFAYRDAVSGLKGRIGGQRDVVKEVGRAAFDFSGPCAACRCRQACYHFTDIGEHPEKVDTLCPRAESTLVFAGGSITESELEADPDRVWTRPVEQGDLLAAVLEGFETVLLIDGYFHTKFPCTTLEVMLAIEQGVNVFGAASMGALRAAELEAYGMTGMGYVFETLKQQDIMGYHLVAQTYHEDDRPLTVPLVEIRYFLEQALAAGLLDAAAFRESLDLAEQIPFMQLNWRVFFARVSSEALQSFYDEQGAAAFEVKRQDAQLLLQAYKQTLLNRHPGWVKQHYADMKERMITRLFSKYDESPDRSLPTDWREEPGDDLQVNHDRRSCSAEETIRRARNFFADMDIPVAETTCYDEARASFIISTFLVPFYFLDYYPSSATGNGARREDAEAGAWMELVERASVCGMHIRDHAEHDWPDAHFPVTDLPQYVNWGTRAEVKEHLTHLHGLVRVSDIATGDAVIIPKFATMFHYSGTDGYASGNTRTEALLYALYELVERDTCQMILRDEALRNRLSDCLLDPQVLDEASQALIGKAAGRGCRMLVFLLPNLYDLPCIMVQVYDENQRVQVHGGVAVRADLQAAASSALHEAWMQYITYYAGTRDDYQPFAASKRAAIAYANARALYFDEVGKRPLPERKSFTGLADELDHLLRSLLDEDIEHILVADTSPREDYRLHSVKVIVPRLELWFCPKYQPSPFFAGRVERLKAR